MKADKRSARTTNGVSKGFPFNRILETSEAHVLHVPADITVWAISLFDEIQRFIRKNAVSARAMKKRGGGCHDVLTGNRRNVVATSNVIVRVVAPYVLNR